MYKLIRNFLVSFFARSHVEKFFSLVFVITPISFYGSIKNINVLNDFPEKLDIGFQDPATGLIESLILLHHDIMFFELIILVTVLYFFYFILY